MFEYDAKNPPKLASKLVVEYWSDIYGVINNLEFGTSSSIGLMALFDLIAHYIDVRDEWIRDGGSAISENNKGDQSKNPALSGFLQIQKQLQSMLGEYGLTPMSCAKLKNISKGLNNTADDELDRFFTAAG